MSQNPAYIADGDISVSRFVTGGASDFTVTEADANELIFGISQEGPRLPPGIYGADAKAAVDGEALRVYGLGETCMLEVGDSVSAFRFLKADADGKGVHLATGTATLQYYGALSLENGAAGEKIRVQVIPGLVLPA
jgi:hypothetical protein